MDNFIDDIEKINDLLILSKDDFLKSYSYLTENEYENTKNIIMTFAKSKKKLNNELNSNIKEVEYGKIKI